ncbi:MAG: hypothetical protein F6K41_14160, partial [Symploca sp. SIO3E6]|nr:hypothetical protein [Caldora sp. SIO3E6]
MMNGLIILVPYSTGQEFYRDEFDSDEDDEFDSDEDDELDSDEDDEIDSDEDDEFDPDEDAYLPVYVETEDKDLALMAVAYQACVKYRYVTFSSSYETAGEWEERG